MQKCANMCDQTTSHLIEENASFHDIDFKLLSNNMLLKTSINTYLIVLRRKYVADIFKCRVLYF